jgi:hypothetical protein
MSLQSSLEQQLAGIFNAQSSTDLMPLVSDGCGMIGDIPSSASAIAAVSPAPPAWLQTLLTSEYEMTAEDYTGLPIANDGKFAAPSVNFRLQKLPAIVEHHQQAPMMVCLGISVQRAVSDQHPTKQSAVG